MNRIRSWVGINPIIVKELRSRMRGGRAFIILSLMLVLNAATLGGVLYLIVSNPYTTLLSPQIGQILFGILASLELLMVCAVAPAVTAGAISGESEKLTYELLLATPLSPISILWGKLISALSYVLLLLFAAIPLASLVFIFGGVTISEMLRGLAMLLVIAVMLAVLGLFFSCLFKRTGRATLAALFTVAILMVVPLFFAILMRVTSQNEMPRWFLAISPLPSLLSTIVQRGGGFNSFAINELWGDAITPVSSVDIPRPLYHYSLPLYAGLTFLFYIGAVGLVNPTYRWRLTRRQLLTSLAILVLFTALVTGGFIGTSPRYEHFKPAETPTSTPFPQGISPTLSVVIDAEAVNAMPTPTLPFPQSGIEDAGERVQIYAALLPQILAIGQTRQNIAQIPILYLLKATNDDAGDLNMPRAGSVPIPEQTRDIITSRLEEMSIQSLWVDSVDDVPSDGQVITAAITLGNIHRLAEDKVSVSASLYLPRLETINKTFLFTRTNGFWQMRTE